MPEPEGDNRLKRAQPGSVDNTTEPDFLVIGRVIRPHGVRGEVRVEIHTQLPERFTWLEQVYVARDPNDATPEAVPVKQARFHKGQALLLLGGHETRDAAEMLRGAWLLVPKAEAIPLEDDEVYHYQLQGLQVYTEAGEHLGILTDILETGANEVFIVNGERGELLLPNIEEVVRLVDLEAGRMTVHLLPGLLP